MSWTLRDLLTKGHPSEILPDQLPIMERAARRYVGDPHIPREDRQRIERVWLQPPEDEAEPVTLFPDGGPA